MTSGSQPALATRELDNLRMAQALELAENAIGLSDPNPRVGCVIGNDDGHVLGSGWTQQVGGPHAEAMALADARAKGLDVRGATAWVTLEPCAHHGRTPPCCDALIEAGIARVVVAIEDPFPQVAGAGIARMRAKGVLVDMASTADATASYELNIGFFSRLLRNRPWVRMKIAASLDGVTVLANGTRQWITGPDARQDGHHWRRRASAVMTGIGTVLTDDPRLDVRFGQTTLQPLRVVVDSQLRMPSGARIVGEPGRCLVVTKLADAAKAQTLNDVGVEVLVQTDSSVQVDLKTLVNVLSARGVNELHIEAGSQLNGSLLKLDLVDELLIYLAPRIIGLGVRMASIDRVNYFDELAAFKFIETKSIGCDIRVLARRSSSDRY